LLYWLSRSRFLFAVVFEDGCQYQGDSEEFNLHTEEDYTDCNINIELDGIQKEQLMEL
jgi:hypothetical protein